MHKVQKKYKNPRRTGSKSVSHKEPPGEKQHTNIPPDHGVLASIYLMMPVNRDGGAHSASRCTGDVMAGVVEYIPPGHALIFHKHLFRQVPA
jgi:hypothetical protein